MTADASSEGGASDNCKANYKLAQQHIGSLGNSASGRALLSSAFRLCQPLQSLDDAYQLLSWTQQPWAYLAMGNFPFSSSYLLHGKGMLPPYPVRVACSYLSDPNLGHDDQKLMEGVRAAVDMYYNYTHTVPCFDPAQSSVAAASLPLRRRMGWRPSGVAHGKKHQQLNQNSCYGDWGNCGFY